MADRDLLQLRRAWSQGGNPDDRARLVRALERAGAQGKLCELGHHVLVGSTAGWAVVRTSRQVGYACSACLQDHILIPWVGPRSGGGATYGPYPPLRCVVS